MLIVNKMRRYTFFQALNPEFEFAACMQSVLKLRGFYEPSQSEIADMLKIGSDGFPKASVEEIVNKTGVNGFNHLVPFVNTNGIDWFFGDFIKNKDKDFIVAYNARKLFQLPDRNPIAAFNLVIGYDKKTERVKLHNPLDREKPIIADIMMSGNKSGLIDCMQARDDERYGVYVIG